ncbi:MAG TPA: TolC family protein [Methylomirabilota bacterium]|nr:TolC family protein [Methylomirabilota bacterium]
MLKLVAGIVALGSTLHLSLGQEVSGSARTNTLTLQETVQRVLDYNDGLQIKMLDNEIARRQWKAERGIFEPAFIGSWEHIKTERENTSEQAAAQSGANLLYENNNVYNSGLEFLSPIGSRFRIGYTVRELHNNITPLFRTKPNETEYATTVGITATQPLLKGFGTAATLVRIRLAAANSEIAYQEYRRQLMLLVSRAEAAYWDLFLTQEQERISTESVTLAERIFQDNRSRVEAGRSSQLEVLQSEAGVALRRSRLSDSRQKLAEAVNQLSTMFSGSTLDNGSGLRAAQTPEAREIQISYYDAFKDAFDLNPDYVSRRKQAVAENIRLAYAKNQRLPQLDLKASYGVNGLGGSLSSAHTDFNDLTYDAWTVGLEMRIPVTGGIREKNELEAAKLSKQKALLGIKEIEVQIGNALDTAILKVRNLAESIRNYQSVENFNKELLETQLARLEVGQIESRLVLETEEKLSEARIAIADALVQYQKALLELELIQGSTLRNRGIDLTKPDLENKTQMLLASEKFNGPYFRELKREAQSEYEVVKGMKPSLSEKTARPAALPPASADTNLSPADQERALKALREGQQ